jgi:hypothetical protein
MKAANITSFTNLTIVFVVLVVLMFLYTRMENKRIREEDVSDYSKLQEYLMNDTDLGDSKKPIMWIHIPYEYNSRNWTDFGSRSSMELNQPYLYLTVKSIIHHCKDSFRICMIDDNTFGKLLPSWNININLVSDPIKKNIRRLGMAKILYTYGGIIVPISFLCMKDLIDMYSRGTSHSKLFVCQNLDRNSTSNAYEFYPDVRFMGAEKEHPLISGFIDYIQRIISQDSTAESVFLGKLDRWMQHKIEDGNVNMINGMEIGVKNLEEQPILLEDLLSDNYIDFYSNMYGILIPARDILKMRKYEWFSRLSTKQALQANTILSKYMIVANSPNIEGNDSGVLKPLKANPEWRPKWIGVPSQAPVWGISTSSQYGGLGDNLIRSDNPISYQ